MAKLLSNVIHIKRPLKGHDCEWFTFYKGEEVPSELVKLALYKGALFEEESTKDVSKSTESVKETDLSSLSKDELEELAQEKFGVDLDKRKSLKTLREQFQRLLDNA